MPQTDPERRPRALPWPLLGGLAVLVLTPVAIIAPTLVDGKSAINTVVGGKRIFMGRTRGGVAAPAGVEPLTVPGGVCWLFKTGTQEKYLIYFGDGTVERNPDDTIQIML